MGPIDEHGIIEQVRHLLSEMDLRYQQRFDAQTKAIDAAMVASEKAINAALSAAEKAVTKAEISTDKRFENVNEFRGALQDLQSKLATRAELTAMRDSLSERISDLMTRLDKIEGKSAGMNAGWVILAGAIGLIAAIVALFLKYRNP